MAIPFDPLLRGLVCHVSGEPPPAWIGEVRTHSAAVEPGDLFVAVPGHRHDGVAFVDDAVRRGARVVVAETAAGPEGGPRGVTWVRVPSARAALSRLAANRHGHPSRRLVTVGITGTTGKTTAGLLLHHLLTAAGWRTGLVGSLGVWTGRRRRPGGLTTPDPLELHGHLREMVEAGCSAVVMEVSSQGADQHRVDDVHFDLGVVTNLAPLEHLEYHPSYAHYVAAKARFVAQVPPSGGVLMGEGEAAARLAPAARAPVVLFGRGDGCHLQLLDVGCAGAANRLRVALPPGWPPLRRTAGPGGPPLGARGSPLTTVREPGRTVVEWSAPLLGAHHAHNVLAATGAALWLGVPVQEVVGALPSFPAPRRRTQVLMTEPFTVVDDTAARPDSIAASFQAAQSLPHRRLVVVYAVRGGRGREINRANGLQLAREVRRSRATLFVTASVGDTDDVNRVHPDEWDACWEGLTAGGVHPPFFVQLPGAIRAAVDRLRAGDLLLLLGAQGMDAGARYLMETLASRGLLLAWERCAGPGPAEGAVPHRPPVTVPWGDTAAPAAWAEPRRPGGWPGFAGQGAVVLR